MFDFSPFILILFVLLWRGIKESPRFFQLGLRAIAGAWWLASMVDFDRAPPLTSLHSIGLEPIRCCIVSLKISPRVLAYLKHT
jgi:hypothetical protein